MDQELMCLAIGRAYDIPTVALRYFNVYGPGQKPDSMYAAVIPAFINAMIDGREAIIHGDGEQRRDFVHADDVVRANLLAAESEAAVGQVLNISGGGAVTINELAGILQEIIPDAPAPVHEPPREVDIFFSEAVIDRAWQALGYRPEVTLVEGLRSTVKWFRQERLRTPR
jgi:UDP-glucose 4-epimerase